MELNKTITSSVYVVTNNKVLLQKHKKYNTLFPLGDKMNENEVPHETVGHKVENIDFIYFARAISNEINPQRGESKELYWFTKEEIENHDNIKPNGKVMALDALRILTK